MYEMGLLLKIFGSIMDGLCLVLLLSKFSFAQEGYPCILSTLLIHKLGGRDYQWMGYLLPTLYRF
jgi:hypothetical protein